MLDDARFYRSLGFSQLPLRGKTPVLRQWKHLTERHPTDGELVEWFEQARHNIGIICGKISGIVALDADSQEATDHVTSNLPSTEMCTRTAKGIHFFYRLAEGQHVPPQVRINKMMLDVRGDASYVVAAPSIHPDTGTPYERMGSWRLKDVPFFDPSWIEPVETPSRSGARGSIRNLDAYLAKVESIQGRRGSAGLVRACALCRDCGLTEAAAMVKLITWNQSPAVQPPWELDELARAVSRTYKKRIST